MASLFRRGNGYTTVYPGWARNVFIAQFGALTAEYTQAVYYQLPAELKPRKKSLSVSRFPPELQRMLEGIVAPRNILLYDQALKAIERLVGDLKLSVVFAYHINLFKSLLLKEVASATVVWNYCCLEL